MVYFVKQYFLKILIVYFHQSLLITLHQSDICINQKQNKSAFQMLFNFQNLRAKYQKKSIQKEKVENNQERLVLLQDLKVNPEVESYCNQISRDYVNYYNHHRYFYFHTDDDHLDILDKIKKDEFLKLKIHQKNKVQDLDIIYQIAKPFNQKPLTKEVSKKKKAIQEQTRFKRIAYLFRKNIKIIISKLKKSKVTFKEIVQKQLYSEQPYKFGRAIFEAVKCGDETKVWRLMIQDKYSVYSVDTTMKTPLIWACIRGYATIAQMLIQNGCLINKKDFQGNSPIYYSIHFKNADCLKILLLNFAIIDRQMIQQAKKDKKMKNIIELNTSIMGIIKKMTYQKRCEIFEQKLRHLI